MTRRIVYKNRSITITARGISVLRKFPLTKAESTVLWHLAATLPASGDAVSHMEIGKEVAITPYKMSLLMKRLCGIEMLVRGPRIGRHYSYKLNSNLLRVD